MQPSNQHNQYGLPYNHSNQPQNHTPSYNPYSQPQYAHQGFLSPQGGSAALNRNMYASTIQTSTSSSGLSKPGGFGLGKLESMGRTIKEEPDPVVTRTYEAPTTLLNPPNNFLGFRNGEDKGKIASSMIFQKNIDEDLNRFPGFNVTQNNNWQGGTSKLDALLAKKQPQQPQKE